MTRVLALALNRGPCSLWAAAGHLPGLPASESPLFELLLGGGRGAECGMPRGGVRTLWLSVADLCGTKCVFSTEPRTARQAGRAASGHPGTAARRLCSEPPRRSWCGGPEAARTCGAPGPGPSSGPSVPGITKAAGLTTNHTVPTGVHLCLTGGAGGGRHSPGGPSEH